MTKTLKNKQEYKVKKLPNGTFQLFERKQYGNGRFAQVYLNDAMVKLLIEHRKKNYALCGYTYEESQDSV